MPCLVLQPYSGSGSATPGGSTGNVQVNGGSGFDGTADLVFDKVNKSSGLRNSTSYSLSPASDIFSTAYVCNGRGLFTGGRPESLDGSPKGLCIGYWQANDYAYVDAYQSNVGPKRLVINPSGGAVGMGGVNDLTGVTLGLRLDVAVPASTGHIAVAPRGVGSLTRRCAFGFSNAPGSGAGYIQGEDPGNAYMDFLIQPRGGNVGIGTGTSSAPAELLQVAGNVRIDGALKHTGTTAGFYGATAVSKPSALTAANMGTVNTGDATSDVVVNNLRTRLNELEARHQTLGLLS